MCLCVCVDTTLVRFSRGNTRKKKFQEESFYQLVFANLEESFANRSLIKSLYGKFRKAYSGENKREGLIERSGWAEASAETTAYVNHCSFKYPSIEPLHEHSATPYP